MHNEFTAVFERDGDWYVAYSPEIPGANGQGKTKEEARQSLSDAIALILSGSPRGRSSECATGCRAGNGYREVKRSSLLRHLRRHGWRTLSG